MNIPAVIEKCGEIVADYGSMKTEITGDYLVEQMKQLSGYAYFLAAESERAHGDYAAAFFRYKSEKMSDTQADLKARQECPEYKMLAKLLPQMNKVLDAMRSHLSYLKNEQNQTT